MPQLSIMPQLSMPPLLMPQLTLLMLSQLPLTNPTPTSMELLMTTPRLTSMLPRLLMLLVLFLDLTMLLFPMAAPSMSSIPPTTTMDMLLMSPTRESQSTPRPSLMLPPLPPPTMLKPSLCFVNIYSNIY